MLDVFSSQGDTMTELVIKIMANTAESYGNIIIFSTVERDDYL